MFSGLHVVFHRVQILGPSCPDSTGSCRFDVLERSVKVGFFMDAGACPRRVRTSESTPFQPSLARRHCCSWIVEICLNMFRPQRCAEWKHATITRLQHTQTELHLSDGRGGATFPRKICSDKFLWRTNPMAVRHLMENISTLETKSTRLKVQPLC